MSCLNRFDSSIVASDCQDQEDFSDKVSQDESKKQLRTMIQEFFDKDTKEEIKPSTEAGGLVWDLWIHTRASSDSAPMVDFDAKIDEFHAIVDPIYEVAENMKMRETLETNIAGFLEQYHNSEFYFSNEDGEGDTQTTINELLSWLDQNPLATKAEYDAKIDEFDIMAQQIYSDTLENERRLADERSCHCGGGDCESGRCFDNCCN